MADEKRRLKRTDLKYKVVLTIIKSEYGRDLDPFEVQVTDVSSGGIGFRSEEQLMIGETFAGRLELWTKEKIDVVIKIVRSAVEEEGYSYGSIFVGASNLDTLGIEIYQIINDK